MQNKEKLHERTVNFWEIITSKSRIYKVNTLTDVTQIVRCCETAITESSEVDIVKNIYLPFNSFYRVHRFLVMYYNLWLIVTNKLMIS